MENLDDILFPETEHDSKIIKLKNTPEKKNFQPGDSIDHYTILSELGQGGMGIVYKAMDTMINRVVAIKIMLNFDKNSQTALKRFQREAEICAKLENPYIVSVYTIGEYNSFPYIVMEYIDGMPINKYMQEHGENDWNLCANIVYKIVQALVYIHKKHIIHRDLKPSNILVRPNGDPVLMDFGIGKILHKQNKNNTLTKEGEILGTLYYASPEQAKGKAVNEKTDIYSLGVVLYQLLTKQYPYYGSNTYTLLRQISTINPTPPCVLDKSIPEKLQEITLRSMEKNPLYRYSSKELLTILHNFLTLPQKVTVSQSYKKVIWLRYKKSAILASLFILLCSISSIVVIWIISLLGIYTHEIERTVHLSAIQSIDLLHETRDKLICTLFKEFGNMYNKLGDSYNKSKAISQNKIKDEIDSYYDDQKAKKYYQKAKKYYDTIINHDDNVFDELIDIAKDETQLNIQSLENDNIPLIEVLTKIQEHIDKENWNKKLEKKAGQTCIELTKYYNAIRQNIKKSNIFEFQQLEKYKKEAQNHLEKYLQKSPSDKTSIYSDLAALELYSDHSTILENMLNIEQKVKIVEHSKETYWYYNNYFEKICRKILEEEKNFKNNFNSEHFNKYLQLYHDLYKNWELEKTKKDCKKIFHSFLYCDELQSIIKHEISVLDKKIKQITPKNTKEKVEKLNKEIQIYIILLEEQEILKTKCLLANFYMTQDEQSTLQKFYNDEKFYHQLMKISLSKNEESFFRFLSIFALIALPDEKTNKLIENLIFFDDEKKEELANTYNLSEKDIDLNQAKLWAIILYDNIHSQERSNIFKNLVNKERLPDEVALILLTHIDAPLLTVINTSHRFSNLTYEYLLQNNKLEILLIKIQQDYIYNLNHLGNNIEILKKIIETLINSSNKEQQLFGLQFIKRYDETLRHTQKKYLDEIEEIKFKLEKFPNNIDLIQGKEHYEQSYENIKGLISNLQQYQKSICKKFKDHNYDILNNNLQLQLSALYTLRRGNPEDYEKIINNMIDKAKENAQSLPEDIQIDIASYWIETGKIRQIMKFYEDFDISSKVLIDMFSRWEKLARNQNSSMNDMDLIRFLLKMLKNPSNLKNKELRTTLLYLFACCPLDKYPMIPLNKWRKNWLSSDDLYTLMGTIFSFSKYPNNSSFYPKKISFKKNNKTETSEEQLIAIAQKYIQDKTDNSEKILQAISYSLVMMKAYYYLNDISENKKEVKDEETLRKKLEKLPNEIINNIITNEELKSKMTEKLKKSLDYGIALGYSNILYNDFKYCLFEDFEIYQNFYKEDHLGHKRNHFYNQFFNWSANLYTERLPILFSELQARAYTEKRHIIFEKEYLKNEEREKRTKEKKEHKKKAIDFNVNIFLRLKYNLQDYVQCLEQSIQYYERATKESQNKEGIIENKKNLQQQRDSNIESILNNDFLLQRKLELGIVQCIIAQKMYKDNKNYSKILQKARDNIEYVQNIIKRHIPYNFLEDRKNNLFQPLIQDYYICEKYLAFSYYIEKKQEETNTRLEKCKKANLWDYDIYKWLKDINNNTKNYTEPDPYLFDRLFLKDLHNTKY